MRGRSWVVGKGFCAGRQLWRIAPHWILASLSINLPNRVCGWGMKEVDSDSRRIRWASQGRVSERAMKTQLRISIWKAQRRRRNTWRNYKSQMPTLPSIPSWRCRQSSWHLENIGQFLDCLFKCGPADILFPVRRFLVLLSLNSFSARICYWHTSSDAAVWAQLSVQKQLLLAVSVQNKYWQFFIKLLWH